jgi:2-iminobutanoate/2-iminopropanoate deaminase
MKSIINTEKAPKAIGPYSQAVEINSMLFISGQIPIDPASGDLIKGDITEQTEQVLKNIGNILSSAGYNFSDVVKSTCMLSDITNFKAMNEVYARYYSKNCPARSTYQVSALPMGALIEIETIAVKETNNG